MTERDKVTVDDIIGLVHTDEMTNSVEEVRKLRGRNERFRLGYVCGDYGLIDNDDWIDLHSMSENSEKNVRICIHKMNQLADENEQLKQYIYDNLDEDICDVCSYQYLEKSQMDKYYVAKCKKGYDNCSKGTVIHCKDFKFKELQE